MVMSMYIYFLHCKILISRGIKFWRVLENDILAQVNFKTFL